MWVDGTVAPSQAAAGHIGAFHVFSRQSVTGCMQSPTKANKIKQFLGGDEVSVYASKGHFRALRSQNAIETDNDFKMHWEVQSNKYDVLYPIEFSARNASKIVLAMDPDREGEAIAWHMAEYLKVSTQLRT
jgi:DNA topoisomerase I